MSKNRKVLFVLLLISICAVTACSEKDPVVLIDELNVKIEQEIMGQGPSMEEAGFSEASNIVNISDGNYAFEQLGEEEKNVYNEIVKTVLEQAEGIELSTKDAEVMKRAYMAVNADYGSLFWVEGYSFTSFLKDNKVIGLRFIPNYTMTREERKNVQDQIDTVVDEWISDVSLTDSDYEKAKYVFETIIRNVDYVVESNDNQNIISVFLNRQTVCQGYACATQYMLKQLGIESTIITGKANNESHAWNLVKLDGMYYYMDTTWGNSTYLDVESNEEKFVNYNYLAMTTEELLLTHSPSEEVELPECGGLEQNYYVREGKYFDTWVPDQIGQVFRSAWEQGQKSVSIKCATKELYAQTMDYYIQQQKIHEYCAGLEQLYYIENETLNVLTISFY